MTRRQTDFPTVRGMLLAVSAAGILAGLATAGDVWRRVRWFRQARDGAR